MPTSRDAEGQKDKLLRALETMHSVEYVETVRWLGDMFVALCKELVHTKALDSGTIAHLVAHDPLTAYMQSVTNSVTCCVPMLRRCSPRSPPRTTPAAWSKSESACARPSARLARAM